MSRSYEEEQRLQQEYFDAIDRFDPIQNELDLEADALIGAKSIPKKQFAPTQKPRPAHNTPLSEKTRAYNLAMWVLRKSVKK